MSAEEGRAMRFRVLVADSDGSLLKTYRDFLSRNGFEVVTALDGLDCLGKLRSFMPEALVLRRDLPWGQSDGVLALMMEEPDVPAVPVILVSHSTNPSTRKPSRTYLEAAYYARPPTPRELAECLRRVRDTSVNCAQC
jgi:DNA-binding response OmpR family regulator